MIFKRKQAKPVEIGDICEINSNVILEMKNEKRYENSISLYAQNRGEYIGVHYAKTASRVLMADAELLYVVGDSVFKGIVKVLPLKINSDSANGYACIRKLQDGVMFMNLDSLSIVGNSKISQFADFMSPSFNMKIKNKILEISGSEFSWINE